MNSVDVTAESISSGMGLHIVRITFMCKDGSLLFRLMLEPRSADAMAKTIQEAATVAVQREAMDTLNSTAPTN